MGAAFRTSAFRRSAPLAGGATRRNLAKPGRPAPRQRGTASAATTAPAPDRQKGRKMSFLVSHVLSALRSRSGISPRSAGQRRQAVEEFEMDAGRPPVLAD